MIRDGRKAPVVVVVAAGKKGLWKGTKLAGTNSVGPPPTWRCRDPGPVWVPLAKASSAASV